MDEIFGIVLIKMVQQLVGVPVQIQVLFCNTLGLFHKSPTAIDVLPMGMGHSKTSKVHGGKETIGLGVK